MHNAVCTYEELFFQKRVKRHSKIWVSNDNAKFRDRVLGKYSPYICKYACIRTYMKSSFPKHNLQTWDLHLTPIFF